MTTWLQLTGISAVKPFPHSKAVPLDAKDPSLLYGVELEIEKVPDWDGMAVTGMTSTEDGSLRDSGREFITKPMTFSVLSYILRMFFNKNKLSDRNYSERTSVHIHANCQDLTVEQIGTVCLLYQCFEPMLYRWIGQDRDKNIFCVPWAHSNLSYDMLHNFIEKKDTMAVRRWMKYSGLNLLPLYEQGTIEFRHMGGTCDVDRILEWASIIGCLFAHARKIPLEETKKWLVGLNTTSAYGTALDSVFRDHGYTLRYPGYEADLEEGVLGVKYALIQDAVPKKYVVGGQADRELQDMINQLRRNGEIANARDREVREPARRDPRATDNLRARMEVVARGRAHDVPLVGAVNVPNPWATPAPNPAVRILDDLWPAGTDDNQPGSF